MSSHVLQAALDIAAGGWPVFPCSPNSKQPLTPSGFRDASTDSAVVAAWWKRWPNAMVGVPTGVPIGAFVVDIDPGPEDTAEGVLGRLIEALGCPLPEAPTVATPRGGRHIYFAMPAHVLIGNRAGLIPGVDIRGHGGYVIVPPSVRAGARAREEGCEGLAYGFAPGAGFGALSPPPAPLALVRMILRLDDEEHPPPPAPTRTTDADRREAYVLSVLDAEIREVAECRRGGRNHRLNIAAYNLGQLVAAGALGEAQVIAGLEQAAAACGVLKEDGPRAVRATISSGLKAGYARPRDLAALADPRPRGLPPAPPLLEDPLCPARDGDGPPQGGGGAGGDGLDPEVLRQNAAEDLNDCGNQRRLRRWFGCDMMLVRDVGAHWWTGTHWEAKGGDEVWQRWAQMTAARIRLEVVLPPPSERPMLAEAEPLLERLEDDLTAEQKALVRSGREIRERINKRTAERCRFGIASGNTNKIAGMIKEAAPHLSHPPDVLDADPLAINVRNGTLRFVQEPDPECPDPDVVRLRWAVRLDPHRREDRISKVMPVAYDPDALCPAWEAFLDLFQPRRSVQRFLRAYQGYCLTGLTGEQIMLFLHGLGANGKSTYMEAHGRIMGPYCYMLPAEALTGDLQRRGDQATPEFARLPGARLVRCAELPRGQGFRESTIKLLTGGEPLLVRHLHARFFEYRPTFKAIGSGNDRPPIGGVDEGIWRRMRLVPWEVTIPLEERRPMEAVLDEFAAEASGILNWSIAGTLDYLAHGLVTPHEILAATDSYRADMDPVGEFIGACVVPAPGVNVTAREMYIAYTAWCHANSVKPFTERGFAGIMVQKGQKKRSGRIRKYLDVELKDVPADPEVIAKSSGGWT